MKIALIVAHDEDRLIGRGGKIPWHDRPRYPALAELTRADLKQFKKRTTGHALVMGRKTLEAMGGPLPARQNIVLTRDPAFVSSGVEVARTLDEALARVPAGKTCFVIGGGEIYRLALPLAEVIYRTVIHQRFGRPDDPANVYFPALNEDEWEVTESVAVTHGTFETLERRRLESGLAQ